MTIKRYTIWRETHHITAKSTGASLSHKPLLTLTLTAVSTVCDIRQKRKEMYKHGSVKRFLLLRLDFAP